MVHANTDDSLPGQWPVDGFDLPSSLIYEGLTTTRLPVDLAQQLLRIIERVRQIGYDRGFSDGYGEGYDHGHSDGYYTFGAAGRGNER